MDKEELTALKGSIATWKRRLNGEYIAEGFITCPLCMLTAKRSVPEGRYYSSVNVDCTICMIYGRTGRIGCEGTPYNARLLSAEERNRAEVKFLESFLPVQVDDNVKCHDSSYAYKIVENRLEGVGSICAGLRKYKVIAIDCKLPAHNLEYRKGSLEEQFNDTIIQNVDSGEYFFTQERFLTRITIAPRCNDCGEKL